MTEENYPKFCGVHSFGIPDQYGENYTIDAKVVLVQHSEYPEIAAYRGIGSNEWVAANGDKVSIQHARAHFPDLDNFMKTAGLRYRD